jgi:hypothetical protein
MIRSSEAVVLDETLAASIAAEANGGWTYVAQPVLQYVDAARKLVVVSRRIDASASDVFKVLADPRSHVDLDGSGMVRGLASGTAITAVGDTFTMKMHYEQLGDYEMINHVVDYELDRRMGWEPEAGNGHPGASTADARWGHRWTYTLVPDGAHAIIVTETYDFSRVAEHNAPRLGDGHNRIDAMANTLARLDELCDRRT